MSKRELYPDNEEGNIVFDTRSFTRTIPVVKDYVSYTVGYYCYRPKILNIKPTLKFKPLFLISLFSLSLMSLTPNK